MKTKSLIIIALLGIVMTSCKKTYNYAEPQHYSIELNSATAFKIYDKSQWKLVDKGLTRNNEIWARFESGNYYVVIDPVQHNQAAKDDFVIGLVVSGTQIKKWL